MKNALGGNSKTIMICAISPSYQNYEQTLQTLRYADRARKIKNKAIVNQNEEQSLIKKLKDENSRLKLLLYKAAIGTGQIDYDGFNTISTI